MNQSNYFELESHLRELMKKASYSDSTTKDIEFILQSFASYVKAMGLDEYSPEIGDQMVEYCSSELHVCDSRVSRAKGIVRKLNRLLQGLDGDAALWGDKSHIPDLPYGHRNILNSYADHCLKAGNKTSTIHIKFLVCGRFLENVIRLGCQDLSELTGEQVLQAFLAMKYDGYWCRISLFLRFLYEHGIVSHNYSRLFVYRKKKKTFPTVYSPDEIAIIEQSIDCSTPAGIRNYAIVLLMSRYGIRSRDISALTLDNFDFKNNRIKFIQLKTDEPWENELLSEVKEAVLKYLFSARPDLPNCSNVFVTSQIPYKPLSYLAIDTAVWTLFRKSGIEISGRRHGGRAFRSSLASNMVNDRVSTEVVRRILGHGTKHAIKHYARIDIESMRLCPLEVISPSGTFSRELHWKGGVSNA
jgi:Site-specific recombinase XerD